MINDSEIFKSVNLGSSAFEAPLLSAQHFTHEPSKSPRALYRRFPNPQSWIKRGPFSTVSLLALAACGGGGSDGENSQGTGSPSLAPSKQLITLSLWNPEDQAYIPYCCNTVGTQAVEISPGRQMYFVHLMFDVPAGADGSIPNQSNLLIFEIGENGLALYDQRVIQGSGLMHFGDLDADGVLELVMTLAGEDGRTITEASTAQKQNLVYDATGKSILYFGSPSWSHGGAVIDLDYDGRPEIIDAYFHGDGATVYDGQSLEALQTGSVFDAGPGMNAFGFGNVDNDQLLEFFQRHEDVVGDLSITGRIFEVRPGLDFSIQQEFFLGTYNADLVPFVSWNGDPDNPLMVRTGEFLGVQFGTYQSWYTALADLDGDGDADIVEILSFSELTMTDEGYYVQGENSLKLMTIENIDGAFSQSGAKLTSLPFDAAPHGSMLFDFDLDGDLDIWFNVTDNINGSGYDLSDRIYLNDGSGKFFSLSPDADFAFSEDFTRNGSYSPIEIDGETYLVGLSSDVFGGGLSTLVIPISAVI